ncbi:hypothetical protein EW146_g4282 [Bondarzewia mesenterica]|uniref:1-phosphatidylinositol 4-kinase n=1 Tax=Bondarzewia mesenterica TaxID=1095465 RepID=A0A4S4LV18_9AGAM|nr:hypothetical protein EW146_g4282 [Bondarzewia mesenterica]
MIYSDNIGITYYLTRRLREFTVEELRDVWGFICHLLVSRPSKSRALECFVAEIAGKSTHIAMYTLWSMQASLQDLATSRHNNRSFIICQRTLLMCHELIFGDLPPPISNPYPSQIDAPQRLFARKKVKAHVAPALVGLGVILASSPGMPQLRDVMGEVAIEQGRADDQGVELKSLERQDDDLVQGTVLIPFKQSTDEDDEPESPNPASPDVDSEESLPRRTAVFDGDLDANGQPILRSSRRRTIGAAQTAPALPLHVRKTRRPRFSDDPLGQLDISSPVPASIPFQSTPSLFPPRQPRANSLAPEDELLSRYDKQSQIHLLRSHFYRSEIQFLLNLEGISTRLLVVPRPARVSALRAELTALNHNLPAEVCMPMWCTCTDAPQPPNDIPAPHHRIVRIPPGECVVLNSAERAPYLLVIEVVNGDLDFDPGKRSNKAILQKIVMKENERKGASRDLIPFTSGSTSNRRYKPPELMDNSDAVLGKDTPEINEVSALDSVIPIPDTTSVPAGPADEEEEIDLVEQVFGPEESLRAFDLSDTIVLPPAPKNKDLDIAAWSRSSSVPSSPMLDVSGSASNTPSMSTYSPTMLRSPSSSSRSKAVTPPPPSTSQILSNVRASGLSLEDYSERMRTAAVMLAQLNANLVWEPNAPAPSLPPGVPERPSDPSSSGPLSWLPGTAWFSISPPSSSPSPVGIGPIHPSLAGTSREKSPLAPARMKLHPAEAAAIRDRIMKEMLALEEERMRRMRETGVIKLGIGSGDMNTAEDEGILRRELNKVDPSAVVFTNWDCLSVIMKTGGDLRQEQLAVQLIQEFKRIWQEENCQCWVRYFRILITGGSSGLVETISDAVSIHSIKKAEYARRLTEGQLGHVTLLDHFKNTYGDPSSAKFARAQRNFAKSLAGYSIITYLLQIKDRHNGNILLDREGHLIHIDFGFMLSNSPGNIGFEAAPFKLPLEYVEVLGGVDGQPLREFRRLFREGFEAARKHCDRIITMVELMQKDSTLPCFAAFGEQTAVQLRERFQQALTHSLVEEHVDRLIDTSLGSHWTRLYDSYQYYSQSIIS